MAFFDFFLGGEEKLVVPLIATPDVDNANRRQEKGKKLNYKLCVIRIQNGIVFIFANYLDKVVVRNYAIGGFNKGNSGNGFCSRLFSCLKLPEIQVFA
jgi:hypothetical protein